ncbi:hypothetical protein MP638_003535, partial [Amoeboaphelidium occidentale]
MQGQEGDEMESSNDQEETQNSKRHKRESPALKPPLWVQLIANELILSETE